MAKWEYRTVALINAQNKACIPAQEELINRYGEEGWELIAVVPLEPGNSVDIVAYFKRENDETED